MYEINQNKTNACIMHVIMHYLKKCVFFRNISPKRNYQFLSHVKYLPIHIDIWQKTQTTATL